MEELTRITTAQADIIKKLESELGELRSQERLLKEAILTTQKTSEDIKKQAEKSAEIILAEAKLKADKFFEQSKKEVQRLNSEIADLRRQRIQLEASFRAMLDSHGKMLDALSENSTEADSQAAKIKVMD